MSRELVYSNSDVSYEEGCGVEITQEGDRLFLRESGSTPEGDSWDEEREVSWEEALEIISEWEDDSMFGEQTIPVRELKERWLYEARIKPKVPYPNLRADWEDYGQAIYKGGGEFWIIERDNWTLATAKHVRGGGSVRPVEEVGPVSWETDEQLREWLSDFYAAPRIERAGLVRFEVDPRWLSSTVIDLAQLMQAEQDFSRLPILGDALMDAGCDCGPLLVACQNEKEPAYAKRLVALLLGGAHAEAAKWLEEFADKWNFNWRAMLEETETQQGGVTAMGIDLHGRDELVPGDEEQFWSCIALLNGKSVDDYTEQREDFYWGCSC